jgi:hypothetical protein
VHECVNLAEDAAEGKQVHFRAALEVADLELGNPGLGKGDLASHLAVELPAGNAYELAAFGEVVRAFIEVGGGNKVIHGVGLSGGPALTRGSDL